MRLDPNGTPFPVAWCQGDSRGLSRPGTKSIPSWIIWLLSAYWTLSQNSLFNSMHYSNKKAMIFLPRERKPWRDPSVTSKIWPSSRLQTCLVPQTAESHPVVWLTFLLRQGFWTHLCPYFVWITEELLQPAKEMLHSQAWVGGWTTSHASTTSVPRLPRGFAWETTTAVAMNHTCAEGGRAQRGCVKWFSSLLQFKSDFSPNVAFSVIKHSLPSHARKRKWSACTSWLLCPDQSDSWENVSDSYCQQGTVGMPWEENEYYLWWKLWKSFHNKR